MGVGPVFARRALRALVVLACLAMLQWALLRQTTPQPAHAQTAGPPNIVLVLTDDQRFDSLGAMPEVQRLLVQEGMNLERAIVTNPLCCPSRATILTGRYSHTTGVYTNGQTDGGWVAFQASESDTIATSLQAAGYRTGLIGKYLNGYRGPGIYVPPGWDRWFAFSGQNGAYYDYEMFDDAAGPGSVSYGSLPKDYSTDVIRRKAVAFIRSAPADTPFFLMVTPHAPHGPLTRPRRHVGAFAGAPVRLAPSVNEGDVSDKPAYIRTRGVADPEVLRRRTRRQWEMLLAVDDLVSRIVATLAETGRDGNTLVIFTSDNGFSNHEHRWTGKLVPYEESLRVPMVVRFQDEIPPGTVSSALVSNVDIAPTIADFAGASLSADGVSLRPLLTDDASSVRDSVVLEHLGGSPVPSYCGVRTQSFMFAHYATGEEELYDLAQDPSQLVNVASTRPKKATELRALTEALCQPVPPGFSW